MKKIIGVLLASVFMLNNNFIVKASEQSLNVPIEVIDSENMIESNNLKVNDDLYELSELEIVDDANYKMTESLKKEKNTLFNEYDNFKVEKELNKMNTRGSNTDPNNAYLIETEVIYSDYIEVENQQKWYGMIVNDNAKLTAILENSSGLNSNMALFKLDEPTMTLNLVSYAINSNSAKKLDYVGEQGIYYLLVEGYSGVGKFNFAVFETNNIINEPNDNINQSIQIEENTPIKGTIDNMFDIDLYKASYNSPRILSVSIDNLDYEVYVSTDGQSFSNIGDKVVSLKAGTYYYLVESPSGKYDKNLEYELNVKTTKCLPIETNPIITHTKDYDLILQTNLDGFYSNTIITDDLYINGERIDFSYDFENVVDNSAGYAKTTMKLTETSDQFVALTDRHLSELNSVGYYEDILPTFVKFNTNWFGSKNLDKALILTLCNTDMYVRRTGRGAYSENYTFESPHTTLVIDTDTKKVVDVMYPNYYYLYGNQRFSYTKHPSEYSKQIKYWGRN